MDIRQKILKEITRLEAILRYNDYMDKDFGVARAKIEALKSVL